MKKANKPPTKTTEHRSFAAEFVQSATDDGLIELSASSDVPYERAFGFEILDHSPKAVNLSRLLSNAPVLVDHEGDQVGAVKKAWLDGNKLRASVKFSQSRRGQEIQQDILDGIRSNVSIGYQVNTFKKEDKEIDGLPVYRATKWEPMEISIVSVPADYTVGVGRSAEVTVSVELETENEAEDTMPETAADPSAEIEVEEEDVAEVQALMEVQDTLAEAATLSTEQPVVDLIVEASNMVETTINDIITEDGATDTETCSECGGAMEDKGVCKMCSGKPQKNVSEVVSTKDASEAETAETRSTTTANHSPITVSERSHMKNNENDVVNPNIELSKKEEKEYSLTRAIYNLARGNRSGLEFEVSQEIGKTRHDTNGLWVPTSMKAQRAMDIGTATSAGALTFTSPGEFVDYLRNRSVVAQAGATVMSLPHKLALPRATSDNAANWVAEDGAAVTAASQSFDQVTLTPHKLIAQTRYSMETLRVANYDIEQLTRTNMYNAFATAFDKAALQGSGNAPTGLVNLTGLASGSNSGSVLTYAGALALWTKVATANADFGSLKYITTPAIFAGGLTTIRSGSTAQFIISDNKQIAGYDVLVSNNIPSGYLAFGNWEELIMAEFGAIEIIVDPYSGAGSGIVTLTAAMLGDVNFKHVGSFAVDHHLL